MKIRLAIHVTYENKSIRTKPRDRFASKGIDLGAVIKVAVMAALSWVVRKLITVFTGLDFE
jgi:hypothetical protein